VNARSGLVLLNRMGGKKTREGIVVGERAGRVVKKSFKRRAQLSSPSVERKKGQEDQEKSLGEVLSGLLANARA